MPLTPLHYGVAYLIGKWKKSLSLPALIVSSMMPDTESLIYLFIGNSHARGFLHSLLGVATFGTALSVMFTVYAYSVVVSRMFGMDKKTIEEECHFSKGLIVACFVGGILHVLVDSLHHEYNPTMYPFINESFDVLVLLGNWQLATIVVQSVLFALFVAIFVWEVAKKRDDFWKRLLVS